MAALCDATITLLYQFGILVRKEKDAPWNQCHARCFCHQMTAADLEYIGKHIKMYEQDEQSAAVERFSTKATNRSHAVCTLSTAAHTNVTVNRLSTITRTSRSAIWIHLTAHFDDLYMPEALLLSIINVHTDLRLYLHIHLHIDSRLCSILGACVCLEEQQSQSSTEDELQQPIVLSSGDDDDANSDVDVDFTSHNISAHAVTSPPVAARTRNRLKALQKRAGIILYPRLLSRYIFFMPSASTSCNLELFARSAITKW